ncbi:MAG: metalloregulator ArsR/SmtB family transcription factor [Hyphomonadaceae bacterium]|nr:metalloregulator ArsR/SmtB family transcription factor [Hyphomonadaceae bacterium]
MVEYTEALTQTFKALADPTRRAMLESLRTGPKTIGALAEPLAISFAATSKHIGILEDAALIRREKRGRERVCHLQRGQLEDAQAWLDRHAAFWTGALDALETALKEEDERDE